MIAPFFQRPGILLQLIFWFVIISLLPLTVVTYLLYRHSEQSMSAAATHALLSVTERQSRQIISYLREREKSVNTLAHLPSIVAAIEEYERVFTKDGLFSPPYLAVDKKFRPFLTHYQESFGYDDIFLITREGTAVFSIKKGEDLGTNFKTGIYRETELAKVFQLASTTLETGISDFDYYPATNEPAAFIAAPILGQGRILGVVALQMNNEEIYSIVNDYRGLGNTGETVIAARTGDRAVFQTPTRHDLYAAFRKKIKIGSGMDTGVENAVSGRRGRGIIRDYRNQQCLAVWKYTPDMRWGMVTKIDTREALASVARLRNISVFIAMITVLVVILSAVFVARSFSNPIKKLTGITRLIADGDLNQQIRISSRNEIGILGDSFNTMTQRLNESREQLRLTTAANERIESELTIAREIQLGIIPRTFPPYPNRLEFDLFALMEPAKQVGGDLYDFFLIDADHLCFLVGDVSGKGIPASLFMAVTVTLIKAISQKGLFPGEILTQANKNLSQGNDSCMFVTVFCCILNLRTGEVTYANAGHNPPVIIRRQAKAEFLAVKADLPLGPMEGVTFQTQRFVLNPGDSLFLYTDGVTEAMNDREELFTNERLLEGLQSFKGVLQEKKIEDLMKEIRTFSKGVEQSDDITMLILTYKGFL